MRFAAMLALAHQSAGKFTEAKPLAREALAFYSKKQPDSWRRYEAEALLGASLAGKKQFSEAEPLLVGGYQAMAAQKNNIDVPDLYYLDRARESDRGMRNRWFSMTRQLESSAAGFRME